MKYLMLGLLLSVSSLAHASKQCLLGDLVSDVCLSKAPVSKDIQEFLKLEKEIGQKSSSINYLEQFKVYSGEGIYGEFTYQNASSASLNALSKWAVKEMGVYKAPEYDAFEMIKNAEKMDKKKFAEFINNALMDVKSVDSEDAEDFTPAMKKKLELYLKTKTEAKKAITNLVFTKDVKEVVVYDLLDNNNENVADAQFVIVSEDKVILVNRFWWL